MSLKLKIVIGALILSFSFKLNQIEAIGPAAPAIVIGIEELMLLLLPATFLAAKQAGSIPINWKSSTKVDCGSEEALTGSTIALTFEKGPTKEQIGQISDILATNIKKTIRDLSFISSLGLLSAWVVSGCKEGENKEFSKQKELFVQSTEKQFLDTSLDIIKTDAAMVVQKALFNLQKRVAGMIASVVPNITTDPSYCQIIVEVMKKLIGHKMLCIKLADGGSFDDFCKTQSMGSTSFAH